MKKVFLLLIAIFCLITGSFAQHNNETDGSETKGENFRFKSLFLESYHIEGYRGFFELGFTGGLGNYAVGRPELLTSHGGQINPYLFLGLGTGLQYFCTNGMEKFFVPFFADFRVNFSKGGIVPFGGLKIGYTFCGTDDFESVGSYIAPSVGVKFMLSDKTAVNVSVGYSAQFATVYDISYDYYLDDDNQYYYRPNYYSSKKNLGGISFKVGFEF